ncbi:MAG: site-specific DNA-methyltransferase [Planctomycetota bacterium]|nr:site-specific DNA-methyltransferase [Planctomycetota bacterium]
MWIYTRARMEPGASPTSVAWTEPGPGVRLCHADWLDAARTIERGTVHMVYADPPFNTGTTRRGAGGAFDDDFGSTGAFIAWLRERLAATVPLLSPAAAVLMHVDWRTSHHVRLLLDELFGAAGFVNHVVWSYGLGGSSPRRFARKHDDILLYSSDPERMYFDPPRVPATSRRMAGRTKKATDVIDLAASSGRADEADGPVSDQTAGDVVRVPSINNMARERVGWPTQKPLALLELLVRACCPPGGTVLDPCCGSGTTLVAASRLGRRAIGVDVSAEAIAASRGRLQHGS